MATAEATEVPIYDVPAAIKGKTDIDFATYEKMYKQSIEDPEGFWADQAKKFVTWDAPWDKVLEWDQDYNEHVAKHLRRPLIEVDEKPDVVEPEILVDGLQPPNVLIQAVVLIFVSLDLELPDAV